MMKLSTKQTATDSGRVVKTVRLAAYAPVALGPVLVHKTEQALRPDEQ